MTLKFKIGDNVIFKNEEPIEPDVSAKLEQSRTIVPLRDIAVEFGAKIKWNALKRTVTICF